MRRCQRCFLETYCTQARTVENLRDLPTECRTEASERFSFGKKGLNDGGLELNCQAEGLAEVPTTVLDFADFAAPLISRTGTS